MIPDDEVKMLQALVDYLQQRITELKMTSHTPVSKEQESLGIFLSSIKSLPWQAGRKAGNQFIQSSKVPESVKLYLMQKGKKHTGGFELWVGSDKFFMSDSGVLGRDSKT